MLQMNARNVRKLDRFISLLFRCHFRTETGLKFKPFYGEVAS